MNDSWDDEKTLSVDSRDNGLKLASSSNRNSSVIHFNDDWGISEDDLVVEKRDMTSSMAAVKLGDVDDWNSTAIKPDRAGSIANYTNLLCIKCNKIIFIFRSCYTT